MKHIQFNFFKKGIDITKNLWYTYLVAKRYADVAELADALDLGSSEAIRECSSHFIRTNKMHCKS